jgi:uncharacterized protein (DUF1684 family)
MRKFMKAHRAFLIAIAGVILTVVAAADQADVKRVQEWRARHEADYTRDFVPLAGLFVLKPGVSTVGNGAGSDVVLPKRAPASVGRFVYETERVRFEPVRHAARPGQAAAAGEWPVSLNGKPVTAPIEAFSGPGTPRIELAVGDITFWVHYSGERRFVRLRDPQGVQAKSFKGFTWFPIDERYRVVGKFIKDPAPREIPVPTLMGDIESGITEGLVEFTLNGSTIRMRPITTRPGRFWFIFRDAPAGKETYEAARFLYTDLKADGTTVLDFNEAYNPPCAFNEFTTCPLPLPENRLTVRIPAGERAYGK